MADHATLSIQQAERVDHQLVRGIGIPALTANIVSSTIGAGIFVIPATVAKGLGPAAPLAFVCCAVAMVLFVTCFAIAGSRVSLTGGLYAYVEVAFGRYIGFLAGVSPIMHDFWRAEDANQRMNDMINFSKNMKTMAPTVAVIS